MPENRPSPPDRLTALTRVVAAVLSTALVLLLHATTGEQVPAQAAQPRTSGAAAALPFLSEQASAIDDDSDQSPARPPLPHSAAKKLMHKVTPGLVNVAVGLGNGRGKAGTGIVLTSTGLVLTNDHVISHATTLAVKDLGDGRDYPATILGADPVHDIAVLQLRGAMHLHTARLGGSVTVGEQVASIGNAHGLGAPSLGAGPVTRLHQSIESTTGQTHRLTGLIEAYNGVQPGESGGPMVNVRGQVIGVTVATELTTDGAPEGHGYAIPIRTALTAAHRLLNHAQAQRPARNRLAALG
jgi:S1-C subfamily serine protease